MFSNFILCCGSVMQESKFTENTTILGCTKCPNGCVVDKEYVIIGVYYPNDKRKTVEVYYRDGIKMVDNLAYEVKRNKFTKNNYGLKLELPTFSEICNNINKLQTSTEIENLRKYILTSEKYYSSIEIEYMLEMLVERKKQIEYERKKHWANKFL